MEHVALGMAHIILQFGQQGDGGSHRHILEHVLLPVLAQRVGLAGNCGREVAADDTTLLRVGDVLQNALTIAVDGPVEPAASPSDGSQHHGAGGIDIVDVFNVVYVGVGTIGLPDDSHLQFFGEIEERIAHGLHGGGLLKPSPHLGRVGGHLVLEVAVERFVLRRGIVRCAVQTLLDHGKAVEHLGGDVQCKHGQ